MWRELGSWAAVGIGLCIGVWLNGGTLRELPFWLAGYVVVMLLGMLYVRRRAARSKARSADTP